MNKVTIIAPTYNEADNILELAKGIREAVPGASILIVDDNSPDGTAKVAIKAGCNVIVRRQDKGLAPSVICGIGSITDPDTIVVIMDADLSHDPHDIPRLLQAIDMGYDLVIGSRFVPGGSTPDWSPRRRRLSRIGTTMMGLFTDIKDMNSGFMAFRRNIIDAQEMLPDSWKVLFELYSRGRWKRWTEVPITFRDRYAGYSKFNTREMLKGIWHFTKLLTHPVRGGIVED